MSDSQAIQSDLIGLLATSNGSGPLWATETDDLDCTFVSWKKGEGVVSHVNSEVDVLMIVLSGLGEALIGSEAFVLERGKVVMIPKGLAREITAQGDGLAYLNVHKRRKRLGLGDAHDRLAGQQSLRP